jgi:tetratricopeptide (TPR) repeat protein
MKTSSLVRVLSYVALAISSSLAHADGPQWVEVRSPHFSVFTDAGEKRGRETAMRFEQMRAVFATLMTKANVNLPVPLQIVAFRNTKEMRQFAPLWHGKPTEVAGLFQGGEDRSFIMLDMSVENPWQVVFHEYAHQLMNGNLAQQLDPWFEEGFAEYFSSIEVDNKEARVGKVPDYTYLVLQQSSMMKVADLFKVRQYSQTYNESGDHRTVFYAESSILVHYLYDNQQLGKVKTYFDLRTNKSAGVEDAIQQAFGMSPVQFDKTLQEYVRSGHFKYYSLPTPPNIASGGYTVATVPAPDASAVMADIHLHSLDYVDKAIAEFQEILKGDPKNAAACRGLGYAYLRKNQFDEAGDYFQRAAQADSKDPRVHYYFALLMSRAGGMNDHAKLPEMIKELETSIALDPSFADPYSLLAFAQARDGDPAVGLETMQKAVALSPRNEMYQYNLAQMYLNNRQPDQAIAVLQVLEKSSNQQTAMRASESLAGAQRLKEMLERFGQQQGLGGIRMRQKPEEPDEPSDDDEPAPAAPSKEKRPDTGRPAETNKGYTPTRFMQGTLTGVDCSTQPSATLTVVVGNKTWKLRVADTARVILFGADKFSCSWTKRKVGLNYRATGTAEGDVVSLQVQ